MSIKNFIFTLFLMGIIFFTYIYIDPISSFFKNLLAKENEIIIKEGNTYKRNYKYIKFSNEEDYIPYSYDDILNIYYNILNNGYDEFTFYCTKEYKNCSKDIESIANNKELLSKINNYVNPFNSFNEIYMTSYNDGTINVKVKYNYSKETQDIINNKIDEIMTTLDINNTQDISEKINKIHNYIIKNTEYDKENSKLENYNNTLAYGTLIDGIGICSGYSDSMALFLDRLNIPNIKISSDNHVWNLVYINDKWLHLDLTWDDTENDKYNNDYFLITKEKLFSLDSKEHGFDETFYLEAR